MVSNECNRLLQSTSNRLPLYANGLANHLPMVLIALDRMGATPDQMSRFAEAYLPKLQECELNNVAVKPMVRLGGGAGFAETCQYFLELASQDGIESVLRQWVPILAPGLAASAFHALIRLAYAIESEIEREICSALAYWAMEYRMLPLRSATVERTPEEIIGELSRAVAGHRYAPGIIIDRMVEIASHPDVRRFIVQPDDISLPRIADVALSVYSREDDFVALHMLTACHAFRVVQGYFSEQVLALRYLWQSIAIAYLTTERVFTAEPEGRETHSDGGDWVACTAVAKDSLDDHVVKLTYSAWQEWLHYKDPRYLEIARRKNFDTGAV
jgi:hypothetical protein